MQLTCPCCFARFAIEAALTDDAARQAVAAALKMPAPLGDLTLRYLALFRPSKRALSWDRAARLLNELLEPIQAGRVERHGRTWAAPLDAWRDALEQMLARRDKLTLPLASHGYLFEIVAGGASKIEARNESAAEQKKRHPQRAAQGAPAQVGEHLTRLKEIVKP
jgi:hypothetical protein